MPAQPDYAEYERLGLKASTPNLKLPAVKPPKRQPLAPQTAGDSDRDSSSSDDDDDETLTVSHRRPRSLAISAAMTTRHAERAAAGKPWKPGQRVDGDAAGRSQPVHRASSQLLDLFGQRLAEQSGLIERTSRPRRAFTVDILRALDSGTASDLRQVPGVPPEIARAHQQAQRELAAWYVARGLPTADVQDDPGEPTAAVEQAHRSVPRAQPRTQYEQCVEFLKCRASKPYFVDNYCSIRDTNAGLIPFRLWPWQAWLLQQWQQHSKSIVLKARQIGVSELAAAFNLHEQLFYDTKTCLMISIGEKEAHVLLTRLLTMLEHLPIWLIPDSARFKNPHLITDIEITKLNQSQLEITHYDRAGKRHECSTESLPSTMGTGRSYTASLVILDEWAHQQWAEDIYSAVAPTADAGGRILGFSSAHGMGNFFHQMWVAATGADAIDTKTGNKLFFSAFCSWRRRPSRDDDWYSLKVLEYKHKPHLLHQEYPSEPTEAFIQSGRPYFSATYLTPHAARIREEVAQRQAEGLPAWQEVDGLTVYEEPVAGHRYILSADVAGNTVEGDFDDASVLDRDTGYEVAALHGHFPPDVYAAKLDKLGHWYNKALLVVERQNHGHAILLALLGGTAHADWSPDKKRETYPNLYHYQEEEAPGQRRSRHPGWDTNRSTKPRALDALAKLLADGTYKPRTLAFLDEALIFSYGDDWTKTGAPQGFHDDLVMARAPAVYLFSQPDHAAMALEYVKRAKELVEERMDLHGKIATGGSGSAGNGNGQRTAPNSDLPARVAARVPGIVRATSLTVAS